MDNKSGSSCKYSANIRINSGWYQWNCKETPFNEDELGGGKYDFESFYCSIWLSVFNKVGEDNATS